MPTTMIAHMRISAENLQKLASLGPKMDAIRSEMPGYISSQFLFDDEDPEHVIDIQVWESTEAHQAWFAVLIERFPEVMGLLSEEPSVTYASQSGS